MNSAEIKISAQMESSAQKFRDAGEMKKRPIGKFRVNRQFLLDNWRSALEVMSQVVVVQTSFDFVGDTITYTAFCSAFEDVDEGLEPQMYEAIFLHVSVGDGKPVSYFERWARC